MEAQASERQIWEVTRMSRPELEATVNQSLMLEPWKVVVARCEFLRRGGSLSPQAVGSFLALAKDRGHEDTERFVSDTLKGLGASDYITLLNRINQADFRPDAAQRSTPQAQATAVGHAATETARETTSPASTKESWYNKQWLVVLLCVLFFPVGLYALWKNETISKGWKMGIAGLVALMVVAAGMEEEKRLPSGKLTNSDWICVGLPNNMYSATVTVEFQGTDNTGTVKTYEKTGKLGSCRCDGQYELKGEGTLLTITGVHNGSCPWMGKMNGEYTYSKNEKAYHFIKDGVEIVKRK